MTTLLKKLQPPFCHSFARYLIRTRSVVGVCMVAAGSVLSSGCPVAGNSSSHVTVSDPAEIAVPGPARADATPSAVSQDVSGPRDAAGDGVATAPVSAEDGLAPNSSQPPARGRAAAPIRRGGRSDITFDDLQLDLPVGTLFERSMLTERARQLDGQEVRIRGFIFAGGVFQQTGITSFPLVKNTKCKFGPQGLAYCVILVELDEGVTTSFTTYPITVEGRLSVQPYDSAGFTWSVYYLRGHRVY